MRTEVGPIVPFLLEDELLGRTGLLGQVGSPYDAFVSSSYNRNETLPSLLNGDASNPTSFRTRMVQLLSVNLQHDG